VNEIVVLAMAIAAVGLEVIVACVILGYGAYAWSNAIAAAHRARAHGAQADAAQLTLDATHDAVDAAPHRAPYEPPSDRELVDALIAERYDPTDARREYDTESNETGAEPEPPIPRGGFYSIADRL
jgi:hypothetical protein